ncbi:MAG: SDR family oxidoreductase [Myxococcota bacterium]|nr:SDR family oxidoreductase [Myxococcota bacterium]
MRIVVTGTSRGIGLEFVRQYLARGDTVEAAARNPAQAPALLALQQAHPETLRVHSCDVADDASVAAFARALGDDPVDVLINNAGVLGGARALTELDPADLLRSYSVNAVGPVRVTRALLPLVLRSPVRKVVGISSGLGSIADNTSGGYYGYRMSKAALNMFARSLAVDFRDQGLISVVINPGWVQTDMGGPSAPTPVAESVGLMIALIDRLTQQDSGCFLHFRGSVFPW